MTPRANRQSTRPRDSKTDEGLQDVAQRVAVLLDSVGSVLLGVAMARGGMATANGRTMHSLAEQCESLGAKLSKAAR